MVVVKKFEYRRVFILSTSCKDGFDCLWIPIFKSKSIFYDVFVETCVLSFQNRELQIMRRLEHCNIVKLKYFFYSSGDKVRILILIAIPLVHVGNKSSN